MGLLVFFGQSSGAAAPITTDLLAQKGLLFLTRASLMHYTARREELLTHAHRSVCHGSLRSGTGSDHAGVCLKQDAARCSPAPADGERENLLII